MNLKFKNPVFKENSLNLTVKRGVKWSLIPIPEEGFPITDASDKEEKVLGYARPTNIQVVPFSLLRDANLEFEYDPSCRTYFGLFNVMKEIYEGFDSIEIVTLITFIYHK